MSQNHTEVRWSPRLKLRFADRLPPTALLDRSSPDTSRCYDKHEFFIRQPNTVDTLDAKPKGNRTPRSHRLGQQTSQPAGPKLNQLPPTNTAPSSTQPPNF